MQRALQSGRFGRIWTSALGLSFALLSLGCGDDSDDTADANEQLCMDLTDKLEECKSTLDTSMGCRSTPTDAERCSAECVVQGKCAEITGKPGDNSFYRCLAACSGADPDAFICLDGRGYLAARGVCDGEKQCPDGSDEADCSMP